MQPPDGALPFSDVTGLLAAAATAEKQQALVARIYLAPPSNPTTSSSVDQFAHLSSIAKQLQQFIWECTQHSDYIDGQDYIWNREPPSISVILPTSSSRASASKLATQQQAHVLFYLRTGGECIEDEWFATHLLLRASTHFSQHRPCISLEDEDGQFLLIEAADHLPDWVTPESVINRVWIFEGHLHLIPPQHKDSNDAPISAAHAVQLVVDRATLTRASDDIEAAAFARAYEFPSAAGPHHHRTLAYLPRRVAQVLAAGPQLISNCVLAIQSRDIISSRSGSRLVHFPPPPPPPSATSTSSTSTADSNNGIVLTQVRMTRHLYAQLLYDRFFPPRQLGPHWQAAVEKYRMHLFRQPSTKIEDVAETSKEMREGRWKDLGAKIWCGMEMAYTESLSRRTRTRARPMADAEPAIHQQERERLIISLKKLGYFQDELEGSTRWKKLESEALAQYSKGLITTTADGRDEAMLCDSIDNILQDPITVSLPLKDFAPSLTADSPASAEDDDSWLSLDAKDIDAILETKTSSSSASSNPISEQDTFARLSMFNSKMQDFIKTKSTADGALFEDELTVDDMLIDDEDLLFEDIGDEDQEAMVRKEVENRMQRNGEEEKRKTLERLIPRMSDYEWTRKPPVTVESDASNVDEAEGLKLDFVSSIDRIATSLKSNSIAQPTEVGRVVATCDNLSKANDELERRLASQYMRETSTLLNSQGQQRYDGASDSDDEELEQESSPEIRKSLAKEYDLAPDADDVPTKIGREGGTGEEIWEDMADPEMDEETEMGNLLEFARISLGLSKEQYEAILEQRERKGRYVPGEKDRNEPQTAPKVSHPAEPPKPDSFESVMTAMEQQLHTLKSNASPSSTSKSTAKAESKSAACAAANSEQSRADREDQELLAHLLKSNSDLPASLLNRLGQGSEAQVQAEQLEGFLKSFQAQANTMGPGSGSGPVEILMRRFGLGSLPADQDRESR
ncbi:related to SGT1 protein [Melanopsichium pennsylvanicum]|uniref:Related to SGT1 protein n=2 Tax=Melanopsichium pennsylvanicum TaxID=63383 RepID=A0AAJ4XGI4_9BASI|nr:related to SGT1 protein [Melanopsichium pennsylvanicum 4]SNX81672.1 related to SGT1 protein [Melanopsichium pennsylvanicum]